MKRLLTWLCFLPAFLSAQSWVLQQDLPGIITDIEYRGDDRYLCYKTGEVLKGDSIIQTFNVATADELGLHSLVFWHNRLCVNYSGLDSVQYVVCEGDTILSVDYSTPWTDNHRGGDMLVIDNVLYVSFGYGGYPQEAQDLGSAKGKIIAVTDSTSYIFASGVRNVWKFDNTHDTIYLADNGKDLQEEITLLTVGGMNLGWPCWEGGIMHADTCGPTIAPIYTYDHLPGGNSIIGGKYFQDQYWYCDHYKGTGGRVTSAGVQDSIPCPQTYPIGMVVYKDDIFVYDYSGKIYKWYETPLAIDTIPETPYPDRDIRQLAWWRQELYRLYGDLYSTIDGHMTVGLPSVPGNYYSIVRGTWITVR